MLSGLKSPWVSLRNRLRGCPHCLGEVPSEKCLWVTRADFVERVPLAQLSEFSSTALGNDSVWRTLAVGSRVSKPRRREEQTRGGFRGACGGASGRRRCSGPLGWIWYNQPAGCVARGVAMCRCFVFVISRVL
jgi:hypothetical protein